MSRPVLSEGALIRLAEAREAWGGDWPPDDVLLSDPLGDCVFCGAELGSEYQCSWPRGLHPCDCGGWHPLCVGCFVAKCAEPGDDLSYGRCRTCPDAVKVGYAVMGWR